MTKIHVHGGDIYRNPGILDFSANCNPYGMPKGVKEAVIQALDQAECYPDVKCDALRRALAKEEEVAEEKIICGNGAADLIFGLVLARKPKKALLLAPTFAEYEQALNSVGCKIVYVPLSEEKGFVPQENFIEAITEDIDMIFFCNPNNPTGILADRSYMERILQRCKNFNTFFVLDECFIDFIENPKDYTMKAYLETYSNFFLLKAFTKKYAMAGIRLGYGFCSDSNTLENMQAVMQPWNVSVLAQEAGVAALKEKEYVKETLDKIRIEKEWLLGKLKKMELFCYPSKANYIFFKGPLHLKEKCLEQGIAIRDCSNYLNLEEGFYRIAVRRREENQRLTEVLEYILSGKRGNRQWQRQL